MVDDFRPINISALWAHSLGRYIARKLCEMMHVFSLQTEIGNVAVVLLSTINSIKLFGIKEVRTS